MVNLYRVKIPKAETFNKVFEQTLSRQIDVGQYKKAFMVLLQKMEYFDNSASPYIGLQPIDTINLYSGNPIKLTEQNLLKLKGLIKTLGQECGESNADGNVMMAALVAAGFEAAPSVFPEIERIKRRIEMFYTTDPTSTRVPLTDYKPESVIKLTCPAALRTFRKVLG